MGALTLKPLSAPPYVFVSASFCFIIPPIGFKVVALATSGRRSPFREAVGSPKNPAVAEQHSSASAVGNNGSAGGNGGALY